MRTNGKVKGFDPSKGFGFVLTDEGTTAALDKTVLAAAGHTTIANDATVDIDVTLGSGGLVVTRLYSVGEGTLGPVDEVGELGGQLPLGRRASPKDASAGVMTGTCKWFSRPKGYGFIAQSGGGDDVFVQMDTIRKAGIKELRQGQRVVFEAARGVRGLTVTRIIAA